MEPPINQVEALLHQASDQQGETPRESHFLPPQVFPGMANTAGQLSFMCL